MVWYCIIDGAQRGPIPADEVRALIQRGTAKPEDYVWTESFGAQWRRVRDVPELAMPAAVPAAMPGEGIPGATLPESGAAGMPTPHPVNRTPLTGVRGSAPSFTLAMQQGWDHMLHLLFRPARVARWMGMAFCVWISIAGIYEPSLVSEVLTSPDPAQLNRLRTATSPDAMVAAYQELVVQMVNHVRSILTPLVVKTALAFWLALSLFSCWLRARGTFMVVHRWYHPDASIAQSWASGRETGRALFLFRLGFGALLFALTAAMGFVFYLHVLLPLQSGALFEGALATRAFVLVLGLSLLVTVWTTASILVNHFVVPVMYWRRVGLAAASRVVVEFCNERPGALTLYFTLYILLLHVLLAALVLMMCCTCCCASYLLILPFVNGILLLPATIFLRGIGISFLRQWRPDLETAGC